MTGPAEPGQSVHDPAEQTGRRGRWGLWTPWRLGRICSWDARLAGEEPGDASERYGAFAVRLHGDVPSDVRIALAAPFGSSLPFGQRLGGLVVWFFADQPSGGPELWSAWALEARERGRVAVLSLPPSLPP